MGMATSTHLTLNCKCCPTRARYLTLKGWLDQQPYGRRSDLTGILTRENIDYILDVCGNGQLSRRGVIALQTRRNVAQGPARLLTPC